MNKDGNPSTSGNKKPIVERRFKFLPGDGLIIAAVVLFSLIILGGLFVHGRMTKDKARYVSISQDGQEILHQKMSAITEPMEYVIETDHGRIVIFLSSEEVYVKESSCEDHICMKYGKLKEAGDGAVCLPNRVVVKIVSGSEDAENGKDAVAR